MKTILMLIIITLSVNVFAADYICKPTAGDTIGQIKISGDPIKHIYLNVKVNDILQETKPGATSPAYIYLLNKESKSPKYALEIINQSNNEETFELSLFGKQQGTIGVTSAFWMGSYQCNKKYYQCD